MTCGWPVQGNGQAVGVGRVGRLRLLRQPLPLLLGAAAAPGLHPARPAGRLRAGRRQADERQVLVGILAADPTLVATRPGQTLIADKHYYGRQFQAALAAWGGTAAAPGPQG
jgi:hypothetical protein